MLAIRVKDVNLGIVKRHDNVLVRKVEACHDTLVRGNLPRVAAPPGPPSRLYHVALLEMRPICCRLVFPPRGFGCPQSIQALCAQVCRAARGAGGRCDIGSRRPVPPLVRVHGRAAWSQRAGGCGAEGRVVSIGESAVSVLLTQRLPRHVIVDELMPPPRNLRGAGEGGGIVDKGQYLDVVSMRGFATEGVAAYAKTELIGQDLKRVLLQPRADKIVNKAQLVRVAHIQQLAQQAQLLGIIHVAKEGPNAPDLGILVLGGSAPVRSALHRRRTRGWRGR